MARSPHRRQREAARERSRAAAAARQAATRRRQRAIAAVVAVVVVLAVVGAYLGSRSDATNPSTTTTTGVPTSASTAAALPASGVTPPDAPAGDALTGPTPCPAEDGSSARVTRFAEPPPTCIDPRYFYVATVATTKGTMRFQLNPGRAPETVNDFVVLARYHFYDGQPVTTVTSRASFTIGLAFAGDADQPGFTIPDEVPPQGQIFTPGTLAMAGTPGSPGTNRGRLLVATYEGAAGIDQGVTAFALMLSGDETLAAIDALATQDGLPTETVTITSITVERSSAIPG